MKKWWIAFVVLLGLVLAFFVLRGKNKPTQPSLSYKNGFSYNFTADYKGNRASGKITYNDGIFCLELDSPSVLKGLSLRASGDEVSLSYKGIGEYTIPKDSSFGSVMEKIYKPIEALVKTEEPISEKKGDAYVFKGAAMGFSYEIEISGKTGDIQGLNVNSGEVVCRFSPIS